MPTRRQLLGTAVTGGVAAAAMPARVARAARPAPLESSTVFTSARAPRVSVTVPRGWFVRADIADGISIPQSLVFAANEFVPPELLGALDFEGVVDRCLSQRGAAVGIVAYDLLVPAAEWLQGDAPLVVVEAGVDIGRGRAIGRVLSRGVALSELGVTDALGTGDIAQHVGWLRASHYQVGIFVWIGNQAAIAVLERVLASITLEA